MTSVYLLGTGLARTGTNTAHRYTTIFRIIAQHWARDCAQKNFSTSCSFHFPFAFPVVWVNPAQPPLRVAMRCAPHSRSPVSSLIVLPKSCSCVGRDPVLLPSPFWAACGTLIFGCAPNLDPFDFKEAAFARAQCCLHAQFFPRFFIPRSLFHVLYSMFTAIIAPFLRY